MSKILLARRYILAIAGLAFLLVAIGSLIAPAKIAEPLGYKLESVSALNEFRAVYLGLWLAQAGLCLWAARSVRRLVLGDIAGWLIAGQVFGRLISIAIDGMPAGPMIGTGLAELVGAALIFVLRPALTSRPQIDT